MNSKNLATILFIMVGVLIFGIFLRILPYIVLGGITVYLAVKVYNYIKLKLNGISNKESESFTSSGREKIQDQNDEMDFDTSSAIDVDYKDVK